MNTLENPQNTNNLPSPEKIELHLARLEEKVQQIHDEITSGKLKSKKDFVELYEKDINYLLSTIPAERTQPFNEKIEEMLEGLEK